MYLSCNLSLDFYVIILCMSQDNIYKSYSLNSKCQAYEALENEIFSYLEHALPPIF